MDRDTIKSTLNKVFESFPYKEYRINISDASTISLSTW